MVTIGCSEAAVCAALEADGASKDVFEAIDREEDDDDEEEEHVSNGNGNSNRGKRAFTEANEENSNINSNFDETFSSSSGYPDSSTKEFEEVFESRKSEVN